MKIFTFDVLFLLACCLPASGQPRAAVVREEGSNGDREMVVSLYMAGFEVTNQRFIKWICVDVGYHCYP